MRKAKRLLGVLLTLCMLLGMLPCAAFAAEDGLPFSDVKETDWFYDSVRYAYSKGLLNGTGSDTFSPQATMTRGMIVTVLHRLEGSPSASGASFTDVPGDLWCAGAVAWASANSIVSGYNDGSFGPGRPITREQLATILYRYSAYKGYDVGASAGLDQFTDAGKVGAYAREAMSWAVAKGLLSGRADGTLGPKDSATRAHVAAVLTRYCENAAAPAVPAPVPVETAKKGGSKRSDGGSKNSGHGGSSGGGDTPGGGTPGGGTPGGGNQDRDDLVTDLGDLEDLAASGQIVASYSTNGRVSAVDGKFTEETAGNEAQAASVLNNASSLFGEGFSASAGEIETQDDGGENIFRYSPTVNGIPVLGSQVILTAERDGTTSGLYSTYNDSINQCDTTPTITDAEAQQAALALASARSASRSAEADGSEYYQFDPVELYIYAADRAAAPALVYAVRVHENPEAETGNDSYDAGRPAGPSETLDSVDSAEEPGAPAGGDPLDVTYFIHANGGQAGQAYKTISNIQSWDSVGLVSRDLLNAERTFNGQRGDDGTYRLVDGARNLWTYKAKKDTNIFGWSTYSLPGDVAASEGGANGSQRIDTTAVSAHANMSEVYDFYKDVLGRDSFDGRGARVKVSYDFGVNGFSNGYANAFWNGRQMVFGNRGNLAAALDVAGHEYTHAVISYTVGGDLTYLGESGALNEAYADIMGSLIEGKSGAGLWEMGEDSGLGAIRDMSDPSRFSQPEHYSQRYTGSADNGGVHTNSGIFNFAAYKMMTDSRTSGVDSATWARIFYRSLYRLASDASFLDARFAIVSMAKKAGFDDPKQQAIKDAFDAVGITEPNSIRIILTWGETPRDLDSHLVGPGVNGDRFHVWYGMRSYCTDGTYDDGGTYFADLDYDDVTSYGPEITTLHQREPGDYYFYVHDYTNGQSEICQEMAASGATVKVYDGDNSQPAQVFQVSTSSSGTYWNVFKMTIDASGNASLTALNTYGGEPTLS